MTTTIHILIGMALAVLIQFVVLCIVSARKPKRQTNPERHTLKPPINLEA